MNPRFFGLSTVFTNSLSKSKKKLPSPETAMVDFSKQLDSILACLRAIIILNEKPDEMLDDIVGLEANMIIHSHISTLFNSIVLEKGEFAKKAKIFENYRSCGHYEEKETSVLAEQLKKAAQLAHTMRKNIFIDPPTIYQLMKDKLDAVFITLKGNYLDVAQISKYVPPTVEDVTRGNVIR